MVVARHVGVGHRERGVGGEVPAGGGAVTGDHLGAERGDHRAVVRAQLGPRYPQPDPGGLAALLGEHAQPRVGGHTAADHQVVHTLVLARPDGLAGEHVHHGLLEDAATSRTGTSSPAARLASIQRATAVFRPEKEKSYAGSRGPVRPRGNAIAFGSPSFAYRSMTGPP